MKLTRTLFIVPIVLVFSTSMQDANFGLQLLTKQRKVDIVPSSMVRLAVPSHVAVKSTGVLSEILYQAFLPLRMLMIMALGAIGLKTSVDEVKGWAETDGPGGHHRYVGSFCGPGRSSCFAAVVLVNCGTHSNPG